MEPDAAPTTKPHWLTWDNIERRFIWTGGYETRMMPKAAGFAWDGEQRHWWTTEVRKAARLVEAADQEAAPLLEAEALRLQTAFTESAACDAEIDLPCPEGLAYLAYQRAGIAAAVKREGVLLGDEMGLGKTVQAIGIINTLPSPSHILITCPLSARSVWRSHLERWMTRRLMIGVANAKHWPTDTEVVLIHHDILARHVEELREVTWDLVVIDESHRFKNPRAKRSEAIFGSRKLPPVKAGKRLALTGTPIPNRPIEIWPTIRWLAPGQWTNWSEFAKRYCGAYRSSYGWDTSGATNLEELQARLRETVMIRRRKLDVLTELPPKLRSLIVLEPSTEAQRAALTAETDTVTQTELMVGEAEQDLARTKGTDEKGYRQAVARLRDAKRVAMTAMSKVRHDTAVSKIPDVIEHVQGILEDDSDHKIVVFAHHHDVVNGLKAGLSAYNPVSLTGLDDHRDRTRAITEFQNNSKTRVFVGSIQAAGVAITLTASSHVVFAELDWVPGVLSQAEDRCHRLGQRDSVLIEHLVLDGSLDAKLAKRVVEKQTLIDQALDNDVCPEELEANKPLEIMITSSTEPKPLSALDEMADVLTYDDIEVIHHGLRLLASFDPDRAAELNGVGFNRLDAQIGHELAASLTLSGRQAALGAKLLAKYHRQLPPEVTNVISAARERSKEREHPVETEVA